MRSSLLLLCLLAGALAASRRHHLHSRISKVNPDDGEVWAVLVAGSNGWFNYRHQADVAHAYHVLVSHGIPKDRIITMMYDDIAGNKQNPYPGKLFNRPHGGDVYQGVHIDYKKGEVTPKNFLNILKGNSSGVNGGSGRVLESGPNDRVFVYFTDHGATGLIAFPDKMLTVKELNDALEYMHKKGRHSQLVFYLEACESGSMFEDVLKKNIDVYAISAANGHESSWGTYCENDMGLPCLGDLFSVNWMNDSDEEDLNVETLDEQFELVKKQTNKSHVMHFGDLSIAKEPVAYFQGAKKIARRHRLNHIDDSSSLAAVWPSREIELRSLERQRAASNDIFEQKAVTRRIRQIHQDRHSIKTAFHSLVEEVIHDPIYRRRMLEERRPVTHLECHDKTAKMFEALCIDFNQYEYSLRWAFVLSNLCTELSGDAEPIERAIRAICPFEGLNNDQTLADEMGFY